MPQTPVASIQNNFTKGLLTEYTGLNFPENAATDTDNCTYTLVGDVLRRGGIDYELNKSFTIFDTSNKAIASYKWNNVGGDGLTQILVEQIGGTLYFYRSSAATVASPLSAQRLASTVSLSSFVATRGVFDNSLECQFSDGNGYLFIYHPDCDPIYCTYNNQAITGNRINVKIRDFTGLFEAGSVNYRPSTLTAEHQYNLTNQGWTTANPWQATSSTSFTVALGSKAFTVASGIAGVVNGVRVKIDNNTPGVAPPGGPPYLATVALGTVTGYSGTTLTINIDTTIYPGSTITGDLIYPVGTGYLTTWFTSQGNYPSNADQWWRFKNASNVFDPATTQGNVTINSGNVPKGHYILDAFDQQRDTISGIPGITDVTTTARPRTGTWFQGRVWYAGADAQQPSTGDAAYYTWTENIYFSQVVQDTNSFGNCYQVNDPSSETLFDLLPTDGGVITIAGCGSVFKLWPIANGLLVFAANGVWFITGSQGIGFTANDYTITKISSVRTISGTSFVDVLGLPYFWNEESIYFVQQQQQGGLAVQSLTYNTIDTFYSQIPLTSKKYARGDYDPINYHIQWIYRDTEADSTTTRYQFNKIMNLNTSSKAFYPYTIGVSSTSEVVNGINYITHPGGSTAPDPAFKYFSSTGNAMAFAEEIDFSTYLDWGRTEAKAYFVTGYQIRGQAQKTFFPGYVYIFIRTNNEPFAYKIQGLWDYASSGNSGRWSNQQVVNSTVDNYAMVYKKHKIRGHGLALQLKITSVTGKPFSIMGWSSIDNVNTGI